MKNSKHWKLVPSPCSNCQGCAFYYRAMGKRSEECQHPNRNPNCHQFIDGKFSFYHYKRTTNPKKGV